MLAVLLLIAAWGAPTGGMRGPHHPRGHYHHEHHHHQPRQHTKITSDTELLRDVEHIKEDLGDWGMSNEAVHKLTPEELDFHYFKLHDFDNNTKLDGLEILQAIHHTVHKEEEEEHEGEGSGEPRLDVRPSKDEDNLPYFVELIDQVLAEDDQDNDGYLSYIEYVIGRQREQSKQDSVKSSLGAQG